MHNIYPSKFEEELGTIIDVRNDYVHAHDKKTDAIALLLRYILFLHIVTHTIYKIVEDIP